MILLWVIALLCTVNLNLAQELRFVAVGDWGDDDTEQYDIADAMGEWCQIHGCEFIISTGDNFYSEGVTSAESSRFDTTWKDVYTHPAIGDLVWYICTGNHDHGGDDDGREWFQVEYGDNEPRWYYPDITYSITKTAGMSSTVKFIFIDTQSLRHNKNNPEEMLEYLEGELQDPEPIWKFVVGHHPGFSCGRYTGSGTIRGDVITLMKQYNADIYLSGHDHNMEHYQEETGGIDHFLTGGGGRVLYPYERQNEQYMENLGGILRHFSESHGFAYFIIDDFSIKVEYVDENLNSLYTYERTLQ